jgi:hypothetical protein
MSTMFLVDTIDLATFKNSITTRAQCVDFGGDWVEPVQQFNNVIYAMGIIFRFVTTDDWISVMFNMVDSSDANKNASYNNQPAWAYYAIVMIIICNFLILNIFAGVVMETFISEKDKIGGYYLLNQRQSEWLDIQIFATNQDVKELITKPKNKCLYLLYKFFMYSKWAKVWEVISIFLSVIFLFLPYHRMPESYESTVNTMIRVTWGLLAIEVVIKIVTFGTEFYKNLHILIDALLVIIEFIGMIGEATALKENFPTTVSFLLCFRIVRLFRLTKFIKKGTMIFDILHLTIPYVLNMVFFMTIFITIYAVLGMSIFPYLKHRDGINSHANFSKFSLAFLTLLRVITGDGWNKLLDDSLKTNRPNDLCLMIDDYFAFEKASGAFMGCGNSFAYLYYMSFMVIFTYVLLNLLTGIVIEGFYLRARLSNSKVGAQHVSAFTRKWREHDLDSTGFLPWQTAKQVLWNLKPPLGIHPQYKFPHILNLYFQSLKLPLYKERETGKLSIHMYDMILALAKSTLLADPKYQE